MRGRPLLTWMIVLPLWAAALAARWMIDPPLFWAFAMVVVTTGAAGFLLTRAYRAPRAPVGARGQ